MVESVGPDFAVTDESVRHRALNISRRLRTM
jgi:hypothetical protein